MNAPFQLNNEMVHSVRNDISSRMKPNYELLQRTN